MLAICKGLTHSSRSNESKLNGGTRTVSPGVLRRTLYSVLHDPGGLFVCQVGRPDNVNVVGGEANAAR